MQELVRLCRRVGPVRSAAVDRCHGCLGLGGGSVEGPGRRPTCAWWSPHCNRTVRGMSHANSGQSYEDAVAALNTLQSNASYIQETKKLKLSVPEQATKMSSTRSYLKMTGVGPEELSGLSVIHVAGTKGKGSTSAYCESILRNNGYRTGFFSSPHLVSVRERIRINGQPICAQKFAMYFWKAYDSMQKNMASGMVMPPYFMFLTVMAFNVFLQEKVDVAIVEVGIGGEFDSTNILQDVSVVGITSLGLDHTSLLGNSLSSIAWQKAGILKPSAVGFTVPGHTTEVLKILEERSIEKKCPVEIAPPLNQYTWPDAESRQAALALFKTQQLNVSLALQLTRAWMDRNGKCQKLTFSSSHLNEASPFSVTSKTAAGILGCRWPGRNQVLKSDCGRITYFLDGAHTKESMEACVEWYKKTCHSRVGLQHALLLNLTGDRDRLQVIKSLFTCQFQKVMFCPNIANSSQSQGDLVNMRVSLSDQLKQTQALHDLWVSMNRTEDHANEMTDGLGTGPIKTYIAGSVNEALSKLQNSSEEWTVLVTGSLHLVGAVLSVVDPDLYKSERC